MSFDIERFQQAYMANIKKRVQREEAEAKRLASLPPYVPTDCKRDGHAWNVYERFGHTETLECAVCRELKQVYVD